MFLQVLCGLQAAGVGGRGESHQMARRLVARSWCPAYISYIGDSLQVEARPGNVLLHHVENHRFFADCLDGETPSGALLKC